MEISKKVFLDAVNSVIPGIDKDANFTGADCIFFNNGTLKTFNDQLGFSIPLMEFNFQIAVNAKELQAILKKSKTEIISFELKKDALLLKSGKTKAELFLVETNDLVKKYSFFETPVWENCSTEFMTKLDEVVILKNTIQYEGVFISKNEMYCTDNLRINRVNLKPSSDVTDVWLPTEAVNYLLKYDFMFWAKKDNFLIFKSDSGLEMLFRYYPIEEYPVKKLQKIFASVQGKGIEYEFEPGIKTVLEEMAVTSIQQFDDSVWTDAVNVIITDNIVSFTGQTDSAKMTVESQLTSSVDKEYEGKEFIVSMNQLQKAIEKTNKFILVDNTLYFKTPEVEYLVCVS